MYLLVNSLRMNNNKKYLGIRFPFTANDDEKFYIDLDYNPYKEIKSDLTHLLMTPKGSRIRNPEFGSNLLKYIFEPMDDKTLTDVKLEIQETVNNYFPGLMITNLKIDALDDNKASGVNIKIYYKIDEGDFETIDNIEINL